MAGAKTKLIEGVKAAQHAAQDGALRGNSSDAISSLSARLLRNGLAIACFTLFEGFIATRIAEVTDWINNNNVPKSQFPTTAQDAARNRAPGVLTNLLLRDRSRTDAQTAFTQLGQSWTQPSGGAWTLPKVALMWPGSNLSAQHLLDILTILEVAPNWESIAAVSSDAGFREKATKEIFQEIAERRHAAAHLADHDTDIVVLRSTPNQLLSLAFSFDSLLSSAARHIVHGLPMVSGRNAVQIHSIYPVDSSGQTWKHKIGKFNDPTINATDLQGSRDSVFQLVRAQATDKKDAILIWSGTGSNRTLDFWHTPET